MGARILDLSCHKTLYIPFLWEVELIDLNKNHVQYSPALKQLHDLFVWDRHLKFWYVVVILLPRTWWFVSPNSNTQWHVVSLVTNDPPYGREEHWNQIEKLQPVPFHSNSAQLATSWFIHLKREASRSLLKCLQLKRRDLKVNLFFSNIQCSRLCPIVISRSSASLVRRQWRVSMFQLDMGCGDHLCL